jgi:hypothetical protein
MRTLQQTLQDHDQGFLRIITELWGFDPPQGSKREASEWLTEQMLEGDSLDEIVAALPDQASHAFFDLLRLGGRLPWHSWIRQFGDLRSMGPGRRDREQPWRNPHSTCEVLWYRGLLGRAFLDTPKGPEEFAYIPIDVLERMEIHPGVKQAHLLDAITPPVHRLAAAATILDDCTTILAALRRQTKPSIPPEEAVYSMIRSHLIDADSMGLCLALLPGIGLFPARSQEADLEAVRDFLLADRMLSLQQLYTTWKSSIQWNDLDALTHLRKGSDEWPNDPTLARQTLIRRILQLEIGEWYSVAAFIRAVYEDDPGFQRPAGNFESWYLQDRDGAPLNGIEHWYAIEGALLRSMLKGPLRWFGAVQLGYDLPKGPITSFTPTKLSVLLENPKELLPTVAEKAKATIRADGLISVPRLASRSMRYQLARFLDWDRQIDRNYQYRLSIRAIKQAQQQGLNLKQVQSLLSQASEAELPPTTLQAMQRFEHQEYEAGISEDRLLRCSDPSLMNTLLTHASTKRYIAEPLNDTTAVVHPEKWEDLLRAAARLGILIDNS